jgi:hypothetical protein
MADCKYGDPTCPCQDGDMCHYEGPNAWPPPAEGKFMPEPSNLDLLHEATKGFNSDERRSFDSYLIGVLSNRTPRESWESAIRIALECHEEAKKPKVRK